MSFKIAYCAGHYLETPGKRVPAYMGLGDVREWTLNDRVADYFAEAAGQYGGVELLRTDDPTGKTDISIRNRTAKANTWGADLYIDMHHNAGIDGGLGGGVVVFSYPRSAKGAQYRNAVYEAIIAAGGLKGNRAQPLQEKAFDSLALTKMPAILAEYGFMDSQADTPVILTEDYARKVAYATMVGVAKAVGLTHAEETGVQAFIRRIQEAIGATVDGIAGPETIGKTPTVSATKNRAHPVVEILQQQLYALGYTQVGTADGIAGPKFTAAVKAFQSDNGCVVDGEITAANKTWRKLLGMV